jgi:ribosome-binding factor A
MKLPSTRQLKVGQEIKIVLSEIFMKRDIYDPNTFATIDITISEVQVSPDMRNATVYFAPLAGKGVDTVGEVLNIMAGKIKGQVGRKMHLKRIPSLYFKLDETFEKAGKLNDLIYSVKQDD